MCWDLWCGFRDGASPRLWPKPPYTWCRPSFLFLRFSASDFPPTANPPAGRCWSSPLTSPPQARMPTPPPPKLLVFFPVADFLPDRFGYRHNFFEFGHSWLAQASDHPSAPPFLVDSSAFWLTDSRDPAGIIGPGPLRALPSESVGPP